MAILRAVAMATVLLILLGAHAWAAKCEAEKRPYADQPAGQLTATEYAVMFRESFCPKESIAIDSPIPIKEGTKLWFWFRLQGDEAFLARPESGQQILLSVNYGRNLHHVISLNLGWINGQKARSETKETGRFDWRTIAAKWSFDTPGTYTIWIEQGNERVCIKPASGFECGLVFRVE